MKSDDDWFFVDANILGYAALKDDPRNKASRALLKDSSRGTLHISPRILTEFYSTITSPKRVTAPHEPLEAVEFMETLLDTYTYRFSRYHTMFPPACWPCSGPTK
jgi:predicted nucleic acid-binding protein